MATSEPGLTKPATRSGSVSSTETASLSSGMTRRAGVAEVAELLGEDLLAGVDGPDGDEVRDGAGGAEGPVDHVGSPDLGLLELAGLLRGGDVLARVDDVGRGEDLHQLLAGGRAGVDALDVEDDQGRADQRDEDGDDEEDGTTGHEAILRRAETGGVFWGCSGVAPCGEGPDPSPWGNLGNAPEARGLNRTNRPEVARTPPEVTTRRPVRVARAGGRCARDMEKFSAEVQGLDVARGTRA